MSNTYGTSGNDNLIGTDDIDKLVGYGGDDILTGKNGSDIFEAGAGNDTLIGADVPFGVDDATNLLEGGTGNDTIYGGSYFNQVTYYRGWGNDTIYFQDWVTIEDAIVIENYDRSEIEFCKYENDLVIKFARKGDEMTLKNWMNQNSNFRIFIGSDGSCTLSREDIIKELKLLQGTEGNDILTAPATDENYKLFGLAGNDTLNGNTGNNVLDGGSGSDVLKGSSGEDILIGGSGNDKLYGGSGSDIYKFDALAGELLGKDIISDTSGTKDVIEFGEGLSSSDARVSLSGSGLKIGFDSTGESVKIESYLSKDSHKVEEIKFADGTVWDVDYINHLNLDQSGSSGNSLLYGNDGKNEMRGNGGNDKLYGKGGADKLYGGSGSDKLYGGSGSDTLYGGDGNDYLSGYTGNDKLYGGAGADKLYGGSGRDYLNGGSGNDYLSGGTGNDTYYHSKGSGKDTILDSDSTSGNVDVLKFGKGLKVDKANVALKGDDLEITFDGLSDKVTISKYDLNKAHKIEKVQFYDGTVWSSSKIASLLSQSMASFAPGTGFSGNNLELDKQNGTELMLAVATA